MSFLIDRADVLHAIVKSLGVNEGSDDVLRQLAEDIITLPGISDKTPHWATEAAYRNGYRDGAETYKPHEEGHPDAPGEVVMYRERGDYVFGEWDGEKFKYYDEVLGWTEVTREEIICWSQR